MGTITKDLPRRIHIEHMTESELACRAAVYAIEVMGGDVRLTKAQNLITEAQRLVADYVDEKGVWPGQ